MATKTSITVKPALDSMRAQFICPNSRAAVIGLVWSFKHHLWNLDSPDLWNLDSPDQTNLYRSSSAPVAQRYRAGSVRRSA